MLVRASQFRSAKWCTIAGGGRWLQRWRQACSAGVRRLPQQWWKGVDGPGAPSLERTGSTPSETKGRPTQSAGVLPSQSVKRRSTHRTAPVGRIQVLITLGSSSTGLMTPC